MTISLAGEVESRANVYGSRGGREAPEPPSMDMKEGFGEERMHL